MDNLRRYLIGTATMEISSVFVHLKFKQNTYLTIRVPFSCYKAHIWQLGFLLALLILSDCLSIRMSLTKPQQIGLVYGLCGEEIDRKSRNRIRLGVFQWLDDDTTSLKLDTLSQGQLLGIVDGAGGAPHVLLPGVRSRLPAASSRLFAAKGAANLGTGSGNVDIDNATIRAFRSHPLK